MKKMSPWWTLILLGGSSKWKLCFISSVVMVQMLQKVFFIILIPMKPVSLQWIRPFECNECKIITCTHEIYWDFQFYLRFNAVIIYVYRCQETAVYNFTNYRSWMKKIKIETKIPWNGSENISKIFALLARLCEFYEKNKFSHCPQLSAFYSHINKFV